MSIRSKFQVIRRRTIRTVDEDVPAGTGDATRRYAAIDAELDVARDILTKERVWRDRSTCLESQAKVGFFEGFERSCIQQ